MTPMGGEASLPVFALVTGLLGGLALFLFGMEQMTDALKAVAGGRMKSILGSLTSNRLMAVVTGAFVTAVIQSSSVTTVLLVGFITSGLMSMSQSIGVIMGANIGTTVTAQILAFKVTRFALPMIAVGFAMLFFSKRQTLKYYGGGLMGLGMIFFGMSVMGEAMEPLRDYRPFLDWMIRMESPVVGIGVAALFTALVQSSSATTGIVIVMASQGFITLSAGIALILGANIGTCVTALFASIGKPREALRASIVHVLFNVLGVIIWVPFIDHLAALVTVISPSDPTLTGSARLASETPRQIANAHTVFNMANTLLFIFLATLFARVVQWLVPDRPLAEEDIVRARYLDLELLATPSLALDRARLELLRLGERVHDMLDAILPAMLTGSRDALTRISQLDDRVDALHGHIVTYLGKISQVKLTDEETEELLKLMEATNDLENIGDIIETNLVNLGLSRVDHGLKISPATQAVISDYHKAVVKALDLSLVAVTQKNFTAARQVMDMKAEINRLSDAAALHEAKRLVAQEPKRLAAYTIEMDILQNLKRIYYFAKRMARVSVPALSVTSDVLKG